MAEQVRYRALGMVFAEMIYYELIFSRSSK